MSSFALDGIEFGVENVEFSFENGILNLDFGGNEELFDELCEDDDFVFGWAMYVPEIYFHEIPCDSNGCVEISFDSDLECAMYMMEHNPLEGVLKVDSGVVSFEGTVDLMGEIKELSFCIDV